jgi:ATP-binding cassette subfamily F protein 3
MIQVKDLSISHGGHSVFQGVSFTINPKERCGLIGRNGSGKTTLLRLLVGQEIPDSGCVTLPKGYRLGYLDQHIKFRAPSVIEEASLGLPEDERENLYKVEKILFGLGFTDEDMGISPHQLSGGFQLRLHLAKVLVSDPDCLLLDEPTNYLDILSLRFLVRFLQQWRGELLLVSHDREFLDSITTHTIGIHRNSVRKIEGKTIDFLSTVLLEEEVYERTRINQEKKRAHLQSFVDRFGAKATKAAQAQSRKKLLSRIPVLEELKSLYSLDFSFHESPFYGSKLVEAKDLFFSYNDEESPLIKNVSLTIERGARIAIIGKNGYGKSTLLRLLAKELTPQQGVITHSEQTSIGYFGQTNIQRLDGKKSIEEEIGMANPCLNFTDVKGICGQMMFSGDLSKKPIGVLSGGEKSRVLLGKILATPCNLLLLDEPTHHLDVESVEALIDALEDFSGAFVIVTHSELILERLELDTLVVCHEDRQELFLGGYEEFLEKIGWEEERSKPKIEPKKQKIVHESPKKPTKAQRDESKRIEKSISELEQAQAADHLLLIEVSQKGEATKIQELMKRTSAREKELEALYERLAVLDVS